MRRCPLALSPLNRLLSPIEIVCSWKGETRYESIFHMHDMAAVRIVQINDSITKYVTEMVLINKIGVAFLSLSFFFPPSFLLSYFRSFYLSWKMFHRNRFRDVRKTPSRVVKWNRPVVNAMRRPQHSSASHCHSNLMIGSFFKSPICHQTLMLT